MADNLEKKPSKGILKSSSSFEQPDAPAPVKKKHKETKWDEMNIIATLHPADKDYGHMKIEEPKTPYNWEEGAVGGEEPDGIDANLLAEKIRLGASEPARVFREEDEDGEDDDDDEDDEESPEDKAQRKVFESKRKAHYNEYYAVKLARKLMDKDGDEDEEEDEDKDSDTAEKADSEPSEKGAVPKCCKNKQCKPTCSHKHHKTKSDKQHNNNNDDAAAAGSSHDGEDCDHV